MKYLAQLALLVPAIALAQNSQTTCVNTQPVSSCTTTSAPPPAQVTAPDVVGAFQRGAEQAAREQNLRQDAELAAEQRRNLQLQNQLLQRQLDQQQQLVTAEAAVVRQAFAAFIEEQAKLPEAQRIHDQTAIGRRIGEIAHQILGRDPSSEAFVLATKQLQAIPTTP